MTGAAVLTSAVVALSSEQHVLTNASVDSSMLGGSVIVPSEFLHSGATTKGMPLAKRSRNVEHDDRSEEEKIGKTSATEKHIEDKAIFIAVAR